MTDLWPQQPPSTPHVTPPPPPPPIGRGRVVAGALIGLALFVLVAVAVALALRDDGDGSGATAAPVSGPGDLDTAIDEAMAFVAAERQHEFVSRPQVEVLDDAAFVARYTALVEQSANEDPEATAAATALFRAFGLIQPDEDIVEVQQRFGTNGVLGYYDPETDELVVRGGDVTPYFRTVLVHELTHALDDQLFELDRPEDEDADDEVGFGLAAVAEGNARRVEDAYRSGMSDDEQRDALVEELSYAAGFDFGGFSRGFLSLQLAPYDFGEAFVDRLLDSGGEAAVDDALRSPPRTSEQVIDFSKYQEGEPYVDLSASPPVAGGDVLDDGLVGQVAIASILRNEVDAGTASEAADGWGGDWYVVWTEGERSCVRAVFEMETARDLDELSDAWKDWAGARSGATVAGDDGQVEVTSCVG